jgi:hypothetical protein
MDVEYVSDEDDYNYDDPMVPPNEWLSLNNQLSMYAIVKVVNPWFLSYLPLVSVKDSSIKPKYLYASILKHVDGQELLNIRFRDTRFRHNGGIIMFSLTGVYGTDKKTHPMLSFLKTMCNPFSFRDMCGLIDNVSFADAA